MARVVQGNPYMDALKSMNQELAVAMDTLNKVGQLNELKRQYNDQQNFTRGQEMLKQIAPNGASDLRRLAEEDSPLLTNVFTLMTGNEETAKNLVTGFKGMSLDTSANGQYIMDHATNSAMNGDMTELMNLNKAFENFNNNVTGVNLPNIQGVPAVATMMKTEQSQQTQKTTNVSQQGQQEQQGQQGGNNEGNNAPPPPQEPVDMSDAAKEYAGLQRAELSGGLTPEAKKRKEELAKQLGKPESTLTPTQQALQAASPYAAYATASQQVDKAIAELNSVKPSESAFKKVDNLMTAVQSKVASVEKMQSDLSKSKAQLQAMGNLPDDDPRKMSLQAQINAQEQQLQQIAATTQGSPFLNIHANLQDGPEIGYIRTMLPKYVDTEQKAKQNTPQSAEEAHRLLLSKGFSLDGINYGAPPKENVLSGRVQLPVNSNLGDPFDLEKAEKTARARLPYSERVFFDYTKKVSNGEKPTKAEEKTVGRLTKAEVSKVLKPEDYKRITADMGKLSSVTLAAMFPQQAKQAALEYQQSVQQEDLRIRAKQTEINAKNSDIEAKRLQLYASVQAAKDEIAANADPTYAWALGVAEKIILEVYKGVDWNNKKAVQNATDALTTGAASGAMKMYEGILKEMGISLKTEKGRKLLFGLITLKSDRITSEGTFGEPLPQSGTSSVTGQSSNSGTNTSTSTSYNYIWDETQK